MSQRDFARLRKSATSYQCHIRDGMVRTSERTFCHQGGFFVYFTRHRVYFSGFQSLMQRERRQDSRNSFGQHGFSCTWRTYKDNVMSAGCRHLEGTLHTLLSLHVREIDVKMI